MSTIDEHSKTGWYCKKGFKADGVCVCVCVCDVNVSTAHHSLSLLPLSVIWNVPSTSHLHLPFLKVRDLCSIFFFGGAEALQQAGGKQPGRSLFTEKANMYLTFLDHRNNEKWILNPSGIRFTSSSSEYWKIKQLICFSSTTAINAHHWVNGVWFFFFSSGWISDFGSKLFCSILFFGFLCFNNPPWLAVNYVGVHIWDTRALLLVLTAWGTQLETFINIRMHMYNS